MPHNNPPNPSFKNFEKNATVPFGGATGEALRIAAFDFPTLRAALTHFGLPALLKALDRAEDPEIRRLREALALGHDVLEPAPFYLPAQLVGRLAGSNSPGIARLIAGAQDWREEPWLCPAGNSLKAPGGPLLHTLSGHRDFVGSLVMLPSGDRFVSSSEDGTIKVWHLHDGVLLRTLKEHDDSVNMLALTPDGNLLLSASDDTTVKVWDWRTWRLLHTLEGHADYVSGVCGTSDGRALSCSKDGTVRVWDLEEGALLHTFEGHDAWIVEVVATPDARLAISTSINNRLKVWDLGQYAEAEPFFEFGQGEFTQMLSDEVFFSPTNEGDVGHPNYAVELSLTPDGQRLVTAEKEIIVWDVASRKQLRRCAPHPWSIDALILTDEGHTAVTGSDAIRFWDLEDESAGAEPTLTLKGHNEGVHALAMSLDERLLISGAKDKTIKIWDLARARDTVYVGHTQSAGTLVYASDGRRLLSGASDGEARIWDAASGRCLQILTGHVSPFVDAQAFTPDGRRAVTTSHKGEIKLWDVESGAELKGMQYDENYWINAFALLPDGRRALAGAVSGPLTLWDLEKGELLHTFEEQAPHVLQILVTPDGRRALTSTYGNADEQIPGGLQWWDLEELRLLQATQPEQLQNEEEQVYFSAALLDPQSGHVVAATNRGDLYLWDPASGSRIAYWVAHPGHFIGALFRLPGGDVISAAGEGEKQVFKTWNVEAHRCLHADTIPCEKPRTPAFSRDGRWATFATQQAILLWDPVACGEPVAFFADGPIVSVAIAPDGSTVAAGEKGGRVHVLHPVTR